MTSSDRQTDSPSMHQSLSAHGPDRKIDRAQHSRSLNRIPLREIISASITTSCPGSDPLNNTDVDVCALYRVAV